MLAAGNKLPLNVVFVAANTAVLLTFCIPMVTLPPEVTVTLLNPKLIFEAAAAVTPVSPEPLPTKY